MVSRILASSGGGGTHDFLIGLSKELLVGESLRCPEKSHNLQERGSKQTCVMITIVVLSCAKVGSKP